MTIQLRSRAQIAQEIASDLIDGSIVNLGIGIPTMVSDFIPEGKEIVLHSENGILGLGPRPIAGEEDYDLVNAGKQAVTLLPGGAYFHHADSFAMMRGGHLDIAVLGAFQVSVDGDLSNWHTGQDGIIPAVGGAMDLAVGAKQVWVAMPLFTKEGHSKIVAKCTYPLTARSCTTRIYTDYATFACTSTGLQVLTLAEGLSLAHLQAMIQLPLSNALSN